MWSNAQISVYLQQYNKGSFKNARCSYWDYTDKNAATLVIDIWLKSKVFLHSINLINPVCYYINVKNDTYGHASMV